MANFYSRPSYTPTWNQRIFPVQEPNFDPPATSTSTDPPPARGRRSSSPPSSPRAARPRSLRIVEPSAPPHPPAREAPPPLYFPGALLARQRSSTLGGGGGGEPPLAPGLAPSTNTATTASCTVQWAYHPCAPDAMGGGTGFAGGKWGKRLRLPEIWRALAGRKEVLWDGWPRQFGGRERVPWEVALQDREARADEEEGGAAGGSRRSRALSLSRSLSRRTTRTTTGDSGIALTPHSTHDSAHPLAPLYKKRVHELNELIQDELITTRIWLALVELLDYVWLVALVIALAQGGGVQTGFLKGVEVRGPLACPFSRACLPAHITRPQHTLPRSPSSSSSSSTASASTPSACVATRSRARSRPARGTGPRSR